MTALAAVLFTVAGACLAAAAMMLPRVIGLVAEAADGNRADDLLPTDDGLMTVADAVQDETQPDPVMAALDLSLWEIENDWQAQR